MLAIPLWLRVWFTSYDYSRPPGSIRKNIRVYYSPISKRWWYFDDDMMPVHLAIENKPTTKRNLSKAIKEIREKIDPENTFKKRHYVAYADIYYNDKGFDYEPVFGFKKGLPWERPACDKAWCPRPGGWAKRNGVGLISNSHYLSYAVQRVPRIWVDSIYERYGVFYWVFLSGEKVKRTKNLFRCRLNVWKFWDINNPFDVWDCPMCVKSFVDDMSYYLPGPKALPRTARLKALTTDYFPDDL